MQDSRELDAAEVACRRLRPGESQLYRTMRLESLQRFPESFGYTYDEEALITRLPFEIAIDAALPDRFVIGAFAGPRLVGMAGFLRYERARARHRGPDLAGLCRPATRGRWVGAALMRALLEAAFEVPCSARPDALRLRLSSSCMALRMAAS